MNQIVFSAHTHVSAFSFEFKHDTPNGACVSDMMYFKTCKVSSEETLLFTIRKRLDVLGAELKENHLYLTYNLACD